MSARRRRVGSESEQAPLIVTTGGPYPAQDSRPRISYYNGSELRNHHLEGSPLKQVNNKNNHTMSARDRTTEFVNAIRSLQGRQVARAVAVRDPRKAKFIQSYAEFMMIARARSMVVGSEESLQCQPPIDGN
uniref:Syntaxin-5 N-terminal Sly1p-binding domain-containing protein n=1 Tax=Timema douglasi TaxID=61478 RepID=A0A7R8VTJ0_TIMDO|nr:unnamed protein product [Timema douglasi]